MGLKKNFVLGAAAIAAAAISYSVPSNVEAADFYKGKTITVLIGRGPGSGADTTARMFTKYWSKYIPGKPNIIAKNMKGSAIYNFLYEKAKPDGLTITFTPYGPAAQLTKAKGFRADFGKMPFVGSLYNPALLYVTTDQMKSATDLKSMKAAKYGGQQPTGRFDLFGRVTLDLLEADYKYITGFGGAKKVLNAMRRREVDIQTIGLNLYRLAAEKPLVKTGKAVPLYYFPWPGYTATKSEIFPDGIPSFQEYYKKVKGKELSGELFETFKWMSTTLNGMSYSAFLPPKTPDNVRNILRASYAETVKDPALRADQRKAFGYNFPYIDPKKGAEVIASLVNAPEKYRKFMINYIAEGAKAKIKKKKKK
jgi:tripartite-type tricarboxylate transporter receptor subunit TctC